MSGHFINLPNVEEKSRQKEHVCDTRGSSEIRSQYVDQLWLCAECDTLWRSTRANSCVWTKTSFMDEWINFDQKNATIFVASLVMLFLLTFALMSFVISGYSFAYLAIVLLPLSTLLYSLLTFRKTVNHLKSQINDNV